MATFDMTLLFEICDLLFDICSLVFEFCTIKVLNLETLR